MSVSPRQSESAFRRFWRRRSRKGKAALVLGALFALFVIIGLAVPAPDEEAERDQSAAEKADDATTDEAAPAAPTEQPDETTTEEAVAPPPPPPKPRVARVIDGDTLELDNGDEVRLVQIDAPERRGECYGRKAGTVLRQLLPEGAEVRVVRDRRLDDVDRDGRLLRYVFKGKRNINVVLVRRGAASVWFFDGDRGRFAETLVRAADQARAAERGAWGACEASYDFSRAWAVRQKAPPQPAAPAEPADCHPSYEGACLDPSSPDYDCEGGSGDGPDYTGFVRVVGDDPYGLDADGDGVGCED